MRYTDRHPWLLRDPKVESRKLQAAGFEPGDRVIYRNSYRAHWGRVDHVSSTGYVVVQMWSRNLGRFVYGTTTYHPHLLKKMEPKA